MKPRQVKQKYFIPREVQYTTAIIILWSLLVTTAYSFLVSELSDRMGHGFFFFLLVVIGYVFIVFVLTLIFSHRLLGPFQRLKTEMKLLMMGDYTRRLNVRDNDDLYIKSFLMEVNKLLDELEGVHNCKEDFVKCIDSELLNMLSLLEEAGCEKEEEGCTREKLQNAIREFNKKIKDKIP